MTQAPSPHSPPGRPPRREGLGDAIDAIARAIHEDYLRRSRTGRFGAGGDRPAPGWERLPEDLKESNRDQARHIEVKLAAVGCHTRPASGGEPEPFPFSEGEVELMARMEHDRWLGERRAAGWTYGERKDRGRRRSPDLVAWTGLSEEARDKDRDAVRAIPGLLREAGLRVVRRPGPRP